MTDKEKLEAIKAEIERLKNAAEDYIAQGGVDCICARGNIEMADDIIKYINSLPEEPVSEELWEAAQIYYEELQKEKFEGSDVIDAFKAGAKWQKEQMMAKAVDGDITFDYYGNDNKTYGCIAHDSFCLEDIGLKDTDKVKMIIVKDEMS